MDYNKEKYTMLDLKLFSFMCVNAGERLSQREIAIKLNVSPTAIGKSVKNLEKKELITKTKTKTINFIKLNRENHKTIELKKINNLSQIYTNGFKEFLEEKFAGATIILFGSYDKGEDTTNSDIDIAVIGRKEKNIDRKYYEEILQRQININFYGSFKEIHKNLKNNILNGSVLCGTIEL